MMSDAMSMTHRREQERLLMGRFDDDQRVWHALESIGLVERFPALTPFAPVARSICTIRRRRVGTVAGRYGGRGYFDLVRDGLCKGRERIVKGFGLRCV